MTNTKGHQELFKVMVNKSASDMHLLAQSHPVLRIDGMLVPLKNFPRMSSKDIEMLFSEITTPQQKEHSRFVKI